MFDTAQLFIGAARAAETAEDVQQTSDISASMMRFLPLFLIFGVFYFLLIRPQQKKLEDHNALVKTLKKGDKVITGGGIAGTVTSVSDDEYVMVEIAQGVQVKVARATISGYVDPKNTAKTVANPDKKK
jgi:preprotein translocase subunit YajC